MIISVPVESAARAFQFMAQVHALHSVSYFEYKFNGYYVGTVQEIEEGAGTFSDDFNDIDLVDLDFLEVIALELEIADEYVQDDEGQTLQKASEESWRRTRHIMGLKKRALGALRN